MAAKHDQTLKSLEEENMEDCCSNDKKCCCCSCHSKHDECCYDQDHQKATNKANYFLEVANEAWEEVLKDKIKEHILNTQNDRMTKLAKIVAEGNTQHWKNKMEKKQGCANFLEELCQFFSQSKK
jgi:hypothetical protein